MTINENIDPLTPKYTPEEIIAKAPGTSKVWFTDKADH
jgi:hypothetical protein